MPIHLEWDNEDKTIIRFDFDGVWTWDDFVTKHNEANAMISGVDHTVDLILDLQKSGSRPSNLFTNIKRFESDKAPNQGRLVVVRDGQFIKVMLSTYTRLFGSKTNPDLTRVDTLEEARNLLKRV
jgi:hypothetical protein